MLPAAALTGALRTALTPGAAFPGGDMVVLAVWAIIVLAIATYSFIELQRDFQPISNQDMTVIVSGHQFGWDYDYGNGVVVHQEGSIATEVTPFVVPTNTLV